MCAVLARFVPAMVAVAVGCGNPPARVALVPVRIGDGACGRPPDGNQLTITAFAAHGEVKRAIAFDEAIDIADFPDDTLQFSVEVVIGGGAIGAAGKTAPLVFGELADGATIPIMMAPPGGLCPVNPLLEPRAHPGVARAGDGVLVVGGTGASGPLSSAEFYDPRSATFVPVVVPDALQDAIDGLAGTVLATLPDGRVVLSGGPRGLLAVFDPVTRTFGSTFAISPQRAFHGAVASPHGVVVAGGCQGVAAGTCNATALRSTVEYGLDGVAIATGPNLALGAISEGAQLFDRGDGYVLAGGFGTAGEGYRFALEDRDAATLVGLAAQPVMLDGGALLTAFASDQATPAGPVAIVTPAGGVAPAGAAPPLAGVRLVALEDGGVVGFGGDPGGRIAAYDPTGDRWDLRSLAGDPADQPGPLIAPSLVRLGDGSVLVLGGDVASSSAWAYRPSLVGPASGSITVVPTRSDVGGVLTASDPTTVARGSEWLLGSVDDAVAARALVGGPRMRRGSVRVTADVRSGGLALIAQQVAPNRAVVAHIADGEPVRIEALGLGTVCTGAPAILPPGNVTVTLAIDDGVVVTIGSDRVLSCDYAAIDTGAWGVAASGVGARIAVATVTVAR